MEWLWNVGILPLQRRRVFQTKNCPTPRAPDVWESARFRSLFLASSFFCSQTLSTPARRSSRKTLGGSLHNKQVTISTNILKTQRLDIIRLAHIQLRQYLEHPDLLEQEFGVSISREIVTENTQRAIRIKLSKMAHVDKAQLAWYIYWLLVIRTVKMLSSRNNLNTPPNKAFTLSPEYQTFHKNSDASSRKYKVLCRKEGW